MFAFFKLITGGSIAISHQQKVVLKESPSIYLPEGVADTNQKIRDTAYGFCC
jgi:hypothetical protein